MVLPAVVVDGVRAVEEPVPPVATVYHNKFVPVAVSAVAVAFWQYVIVEVVVGAAGVILVFTTTAALGPSHPVVVWLQFRIETGL